MYAMTAAHAYAYTSVPQGYHLNQQSCLLSTSHQAHHCCLSADVIRLQYAMQHVVRHRRQSVATHVQLLRVGCDKRYTRCFKKQYTAECSTLADV
eukprot:12582-Heterococcus_DN1.PRE.4